MADVHGFIAPGFERIAEAFSANFDDGAEIGASFAAVMDGVTLIEIWGGHADRAGEKPWARDTLAPVFSTTKAIASIVVARLADEGVFSYDDTVAQVWPEFAAHGKGALTIGEAISHQAGLPGFSEPIDPALWLDPPALAAALAAQAPLWPPGSGSGYHPLTWGYLIGEIVRRASGRTLGAVLRDDICAPLGIDFHIGLAEADFARCAEIKKPPRAGDFGELTPIKRAAFLTPWSQPNRDHPDWRRVEIPSANGHGTALAVARLCAVLATEGRIGETRVLSTAGYRDLIAPRFEGEDLVLPFRLDWRSGVLGNAQFYYGPNRGALGHSGSGGSCGFGDPERGLSVGYVMNKQSPHLMGDPRALRLIEALYACFDD